jgi:ubiquinone/menaquinone biosynthesis C-methylase UbiE
MTEAQRTTEIAYWDGPGGLSWVRQQEHWDRVLAPVADATLTRAAVRTGERVVDVGCGCGATTIALGERVGPAGHVLGLDVSAAMLERARQRTPPELAVAYVAADATTHPLPAGTFDILFSRFGVMFFSRPAEAFANLRRGLRRDGRLAFACFRAIRLNPWMTVPLDAAYEHVPRLPKLGPEDPGPFSFADPERVQRILTEAGFRSIGLEPVDLDFDIAAGLGLDAAVANTLEIGATSRAVLGQPQEVRAAVAASVRRVLTPHERGQAVPLAAAIWIVTATSP